MSKTIYNLDRQKAFSHVVESLLKQKKFSVNENDNCVYFSDDGESRCAIGHLMPHDISELDLPISYYEGKGAQHEDVIAAIDDSFWTEGLTDNLEDDREFLWKLQTVIHDEPALAKAFEADQFIRLASKFAGEHNLTMPTP